MVGQGRRKAVVKAEDNVLRMRHDRASSVQRTFKGMMWLSVDGAGHRAHVTLEFEPYYELQ